MGRALAVAVVLVVVPAGVGADDRDAAVRAGLAEAHDAGADLYNRDKDYAGAYRLYEGALRAVRPLLAHRPEVQKRAADGLAAAAKERDAIRKAYSLHETIEAVRADLKPAAEVKKPGAEVAPPPRARK